VLKGVTRGLLAYEDVFLSFHHSERSPGKRPESLFAESASGRTSRQSENHMLAAARSLEPWQRGLRLRQHCLLRLARLWMSLQE
jgi:hypothetical protein